jgi:hypothetical protein
MRGAMHLSKLQMIKPSQTRLAPKPLVNSLTGPSYDPISPSRRSLLGILATTTMGVNLALPQRSIASMASAVPKTAEDMLATVDWPEAFPFPPDAFQRYDESDDKIFYDEDTPRFVTHIDDGAIAALTRHYSQNFPPSGNKDVAILDMCSSWISHFPEGYTAGRIVGLGMNEKELTRNSALTEYKVHDLNKQPEMPFFKDNSFDVITNVVSVDYLTKPLEVFKEMSRILKPNGIGIISFSNRCFPTKAVAIWTSTGDLDHVLYVGSMFHYAGGFGEPEAKDISPRKPEFLGSGLTGDPMYIVQARKL